MNSKAQFAIDILPLWLSPLISIRKIFILKPLVVHQNWLCNSVSIIQFLFYSPSLDLLISYRTCLNPSTYLVPYMHTLPTSDLPVIISITILFLRNYFISDYVISLYWRKICTHIEFACKGPQDYLGFFVCFGIFFCCFVFLGFVCIFDLRRYGISRIFLHIGSWYLEPIQT